MVISEHLIIFLIGEVVTAIGIYAAIRADLQEHRFRLGAIEHRLDKAAL